jgi:uncharacterized cofD-like protein
MTGPRVDLEPLLHELEASMEDGPRVVAIGGGHGLARALEAITEYAGTITAVVSVADDGGSSGRLSPGLAIPPPGDIRRALLALSPDPSLWKDLISYRFTGADVDGHSLGNLLIASLADLRGGFEEALGTMAGLLGARGAVVPSSPGPLVLEATVDGRTVQGQVAIARSRGVVSALRAHPEDAPASPAAVSAISTADQIVLGPGSLYTSVLAATAVAGVRRAIDASPAMLVYVANLTTQDGETLGMSLTDHVVALSRVGGLRPPDRVVVHDGPLLIPEGLAPVSPPEHPEGPGMVLADVASDGPLWPQHDAARLAAVLRRLVP